MICALSLAARTATAKYSPAEWSQITSPLLPCWRTICPSAASSMLSLAIRLQMTCLLQSLLMTLSTRRILQLFVQLRRRLVVSQSIRCVHPSRRLWILTLRNRYQRWRANRWKWRIWVTCFLARWQKRWLGESGPRKTLQNRAHLRCSLT